MNLFVILGIVILVLCIALYGASRLYYQQKAEIDRLKSELKNQKKYVDILLKYNKELKGIQIDKDRLDAEIEGAENEKKIMDIINRIIADNNRMCNDTEN